MICSLDDLSSQIQNSSVFDVNDASVWPGLYLNIGDVAFVVLFSPKIIANRLFVNVQLRRNAGDAARWQ